MPLHGWEVLVILVLVLIIFGVGKLPQVFGAMGKGINEFRKGKSGELDKADQPNESDSEKKTQN